MPRPRKIAPSAATLQATTTRPANTTASVSAESALQIDEHTRLVAQVTHGSDDALIVRVDRVHTGPDGRCHRARLAKMEACRADDAEGVRALLTWAFNELPALRAACAQFESPDVTAGVHHDCPAGSTLYGERVA